MNGRPRAPFPSSPLLFPSSSYQAATRMSVRSTLLAAPPIVTRRRCGARVWMCKQDPSVAHIGIRKVFLSSDVFPGPRDGRIASAGLSADVQPDASGDFLLGLTYPVNYDNLTERGIEAMDAVHCFAVVRLTLTMFQRSLARRGQPDELLWKWNKVDPLNRNPIKIFSHELPDEANAYYYPEGEALIFGHFIPKRGGRRVYMCRSLDVVAHEIGHAILDGLKPGWFQTNSPQTKALHESFSDLTAIFLILYQMDLVEALIADTQADLSQPNFMAELAEQVGEGIVLDRRPKGQTGVRNALNPLRMQDVGTDVYDLSKVFTGAIYNILDDVFSRRRCPHLKDDAQVLHETADDLLGLFLHAIKMSPDFGATFADVAFWMKHFASAEFKSIIEHRFYEREIFITIGLPDLRYQIPAVRYG